MPRAPIDTKNGKAAPPNAADPAVPIAEPAPLDGAAPDIGDEIAASVLNAEHERPIAGAGGRKAPKHPV